MKRFGAALGIVLLLAEPVYAQAVGPAPIYCNKIAVQAALTSGTTQLIVGVPGQIINFCGFAQEQLANGTIQLVFGTGASCSSSTPITGNYTTQVNGNVINHRNNAFISSLPGQSVCGIVTGTGNIVVVDLYYSMT